MIFHFHACGTSRVGKESPAPRTMFVSNIAAALTSFNNQINGAQCLLTSSAGLATSVQRTYLPLIKYILGLLAVAYGATRTCIGMLSAEV